MIWKISNVLFDENKNLLITNNKNQIILEPKTAELLSFFCRHPDQDITREYLIETVWHGQIVSDNSINRVVMSLRKALGDELKVKKYIATKPKIGYRFIAPIKEFTKPNKSIINLKYIAGLSLLVILVLFISQQFKTDSNKTPNYNIAPLSRLAANQYHAQMNYAGDKLLYTSNVEGHSALFLQEITQEPVIISQKLGSAYSPIWATTDQFIIYLYRNNDTCEFHRVDFINDSPQPSETIFQCVNNDYTNFAINKDNSKLYFLERKSGFSPFNVYELDLQTNIKRFIEQPRATGLGNHHIDMHPQTNKLMVISDQRPGKSSIYELDTEKNSSTLKLEFDYNLDTAVWSHNLNHIVHPGEHPSYDLLETNLDSKKSKALIVDSRRIRNPKRIKSKDNSDYLFSSYLNNRDIKLNEKDIGANSAVMDYLPALSHDAKKLAFISKRSGYSKLWIKTLENNVLDSIEPLDQGRMYFNLLWSFDDSQILANTNTGIVLFDTIKMNIVNTLSFPEPVYASAWISKNEIAFSRFQNDKWQLIKYNLVTNDQVTYDENWAFMVSSQELKLYFDQEFNVFSEPDLSTETMVDTKLCTYPVRRYRMTFQLDGEDLYCFSQKNNNKILKWVELHPPEIIDSSIEPGEYFSVSKGNIAKTIIKDSSSDIMKTESTH